MTPTDPVDAGRITLALSELRLPAIKVLWQEFAARADKEGWPGARFLAALTEHELAERATRRIERHLQEARLPSGKTLDNFEFEAVPTVSKAHVMALAAGDSWLAQGANILMFGPPGGGKSHLAAALSLALVENGWRVLFMRTTDLVQRLQTARRDLELEAAIDRLDKYHLLVLDDLSYITKDQAETSVLFELISARYERRSILITANQPFGEWGKIFPDPSMTLAAVDCQSASKTDPLSASKSDPLSGSIGSKNDPPFFRHSPAAMRGAPHTAQSVAAQCAAVGSAAPEGGAGGETNNAWNFAGGGILGWGQSRPKPRGGVTACRSIRLRSQTALRASAVAPSCRFSGSTSSQAAYSAWRSTSSAMASVQRRTRLRRSSGRRNRTGGLFLFAARLARWRACRSAAVMGRSPIGLRGIGSLRSVT